MKDLTQARALIKECLNKQTTYLDLGNCGITHLGDIPELFECIQLKTLILSNTWYDTTKKKNSYSQNKGKRNHIEYITAAIAQLKNLQNLKMGGAEYLLDFGGDYDLWQTKDAHFLIGLPALHSLDLSSNQISEISFLKGLTALHSLDLSYNQISDISFLKGLTALHSLDLSGNQISEISFLKGLTALHSLDLSGNQISEISFLKGLTALHSLDLSSNQISEISFLKGLTALHSLDLSYNQISDFSFLKGLTALHSLALSGNKISEISFLKGLTALHSLDLGYNQISDISFLKGLTALHSLDLSSNQISDISFLKGLTALHSLDLGYNQISDFSFLKGLTALHSLDLRYNQISEISFLKGLTALHSLDLRSNQISDISFLKGLTALHSLDLRYNQISDFSFLKGLTALHSLDLRSNQISEISFLKGLTALHSLALSGNKISEISFLKGLTALHSLDLRSNQISELPVWITDFHMEITLSGYGGIQLQNNPLRSPPPKTIEQGKAAVVRYFKEQAREDVEEVLLLEAKVLLLGEGETGKTSLRIKLEDENNALPKAEDRTRGVDIYLHKFPVVDDTFISHIWDFGGQDIMYQVHRFFLSDDALYILVTDSRANQGNKLEEWLQTIEIFTDKDDNQILLFQNLKYGDTPANIDIADYKKYYSIVGSKMYEVDLSFSQSKHLREFRKFRKVIETRLNELPHVQKPIFSHWLAVRKELEKKVEDNIHLIKFSEYTQICREKKVNDTEVQKDLLRYLHSLGVVLWYEKHPTVKQKIILNPAWITTALYRIIDSQSIRDKNGKLEHEDIEKLWNEAIYEDYQKELVEILKVFRLAYQRKQEYAYIVPSLMNKAIPKKHENWNPPGKWTIRYQYPRLMPRGIVNQLAAELCKYIHSDFEDVWAFGVVFTTEKAKAIVQEYRNRKQIEVKAYGDDRQRLMQHIVKALDDIHDTYKGLEYDIKIPCICEKCTQSSDAHKTYYNYYDGIMREINDNRDDIYCRNLRQNIKIAPILERSGFALPYKLTELLKESQKAYDKRQDEIKIGLRDLKHRVERTSDTSEKALKNTEEIKSALNNHFEYLLKLNKNTTLTKEEIISAVQEISDQQKQAIFYDILNALTGYHSIMDEQLREIYDELTKPSGNIEMKLKASIPLLNLLGLDVGVESQFDIKEWSQRMYKKYELPLFKLMGYV